MDDVRGDEITCPYCNYEFSDSWEMMKIEDGEDAVFECPDCENSFDCVVSISVSYESTKKECGDCDYGEPYRHDYGENHFQKRFGMHHNPEKAYSIWARTCKKCGKLDTEKIDHLGELPERFLTEETTESKGA